MQNTAMMMFAPKSSMIAIAVNNAFRLAGAARPSRLRTPSAEGYVGRGRDGCARIAVASLQLFPA